MLTTRFVVNAAGLHGDELHRAFGFDGFTVTPAPRRADRVRQARPPLLSRTILPVPTKHTKGVLVAPTVFGNVMLGPTADDIDDKAATGSTRDGIDRLLASGRRIMPALLDEEVTAVYAGLRAATEHSDYQLLSDAGARYVCLGGIRSTGLTARWRSPRKRRRCSPRSGSNVRPARRSAAAAIRMTPLGEREPRPYLEGGTIVCHCERVTADEITAACSASVPATDLDGLRRRTRARSPGAARASTASAAVCQLAAITSGRSSDEWLVADMRVDVLVVGGGPAGLAAATELRRLGATVTVAEREREPGGIPRHTEHIGFGLRDQHRIATGPRYAAAARRAGDSPRASTCAPARPC